MTFGEAAVIDTPGRIRVVDVLRPAFMFFAPIIATLNCVAALGCALGEPFGAFTWPDVLAMVGGPIVAVALWLSWFFLALHSRIHWVVIAVMALWAIFFSYWGYWVATGYFREQWVYEP